MSTVERQETTTTAKNGPGFFHGHKITAKRIVVYLVGIFIMCIGIAFAVKSDFGISPVTSLPYACGRVFGTTTGNGTIVAFIVFIIVQFIVYRKHADWTLVLQFPIAIVFGKMTDLAIAIVSPLTTAGFAAVEPMGFAPTIVLKLVFIGISIFVLAFGLNMYLASDVITIPSDGVPVCFSWLFKRRLGSVKRITDLIFVVIAFALEMFFLGDFDGIWVGTILAALGNGTMLNVWRKWLGDDFWTNMLFGDEQGPEVVESVSAAN